MDKVMGDSEGARGVIAVEVEGRGWNRVAVGPADSDVAVLGWT